MGSLTTKDFEALSDAASFKSILKSKLEPKFSQNLTNWSYDHNSKWITIISKSNNFSTKIDNLKNYYE